MWNIYTVEYYTATIKDEAIKFHAIMAELEGIILNKVSRRRETDTE